MTDKACSKCGDVYDISEYPWSIRGVKRHSKCPKCRSEERIDYYNRHKEEELAYKYEKQKERRDEARRYVWEYLSNHVCADCGEYDPLVLTFDHVRGTKKMNISQMINQGYTLAVLQEEIDKCEVVCNNCHLRREKKRRGTKYWSD
jgi:hypothetical protein